MRLTRIILPKLTCHVTRLFCVILSARVLCLCRSDLLNGNEKIIYTREKLHAIGS